MLAGRIGLVWIVVLTTSHAVADEPLNRHIDRLIAAKFDGMAPSGLADDAEFLRRIYLDLAGRIPSVVEAREFLNDTSSDKRAKLVHRLLAGPDYPRRMQELAHVMLMERRGDHADWTAFLRDSFAANKPLDQLVREMLNPDAKNEMTRGAAFFLSKRLENYGQNPVDYPALTRDVGRLFLGVDLQCAQCHDHLYVDEYKQQDFQGLFAFFQNAFLRQDVNFPAVGEKVTASKLEFTSVFTKEKQQTGPRLPGGNEIEVPSFPKGEEYVEPPDKKTKAPGVPKFSPLAKLAEQLPNAENVAFARNLVNRVWFVMMGRGLVHPLDMHHRENPPSHPELLDLLTREFIEHRFDLKWLLGELAMTETYQRSSRLPDGVEQSPADRFVTAHEKYMSAEQLLASVLQATGSESAGGPPPDGSDKIRDKFVKAFANPPGEPEGDFAPSLRAALFLLNDPVWLDLLQPKDGNLIDRLNKLDDARAVADELYLSVLTRRPTDEERAEIGELLARQGDSRSTAIVDLAWSLLASTEFCINH